jgi:hypothetical protein
MNQARKQLKNWLLLNKFFFRKNIKNFLILNVFLLSFLLKSQTINYVSNGSFEQIHNCGNPNAISNAKNWRSIDSSIFGNALFYSTCYPNVPFGPLGYQWPRTGNSYGMYSALCQPTLCSTNNSRGYLRNRLKSSLQPGKKYCVKFYVNISDNSSYGIDSFGAYFGDNTLDTITMVNGPLIYILPQVQNPINNFVTDTLGWTQITGTFVATGIEKHIVIGNFKSDANTNKILINSTFSPNIFTDIRIDDVSCIPLDLPAYAAPGSDIWAIPGNTLYLGRPRDVGIDEACMWYKLPNITTAIDTAAGITVTVGITTNTYIVRQEICGNVKWDTVVIHASGVGVSEQEIIKNSINVFPNPANDILNVNLNFDLGITFSKIEITNNLGQIIREEDINFKNKTTTINTTELPNGVYLLNLKGENSTIVSKRFTITK